jgi:high-affinity nickel permease
LQWKEQEMSVHFNFLIALSLQNLALLVRIHSRFPERRTTAVATQEEKRQDESQTILALLFFLK